MGRGDLKPSKNHASSAPKRHPFGTDGKRFQTLGLHPELTQVGRSDLGPGQYDAKPHECTYKALQSPWTQKMATEEFSKFLDYRNADVLQYRAYRKTCLGPGWTDMPDDRLDRGITFTKEKRFRPFVKDNPPPGSHTVRAPTRTFSKLPSFERDGMQNRLKDTTPWYQLAPNRYNTQVKRITDKMVSLRGPYDTFTGPRDETTIKNHFAPPDFRSPDEFYSNPSDLDHMLMDKNKQAYGVFLKAVRFPRGKRVVVSKDFTSFLKESDYPAPSRYDIKPELPQPWEWSDNTYPFNSSKVHARPPFLHTIHPGPERYRARLPKCPAKQCPNQSWMFSSKTKRQFYKVEYNSVLEEYPPFLKL